MTSAPNMGTIAPIMGTGETTTTIAEMLLGQVRTAILALLFRRSDEEFYLREIVRAAGTGQGATQRELERLVCTGLVVRTRRGNQVYYRANRESPVFAEIRGLMVKTAGVADALRAALLPLAQSVRIAFAYGSIAASREDAGSDVDLMVVGDASFSDVVTALRGVQEAIGREVNPAVFSVGEFNGRILAGEHFVTSVLARPKLFVLGGEDELRELGA